MLVIVKKIILFWFLFIDSSRYNDKKRGDYQETLSHTTYFLNIFFNCHIVFFLFPFPGILGNDSLWFPFPDCGSGFFSFPFHSRILGMDFFHSLPVPELWEWIFSIPYPFPNWAFQSWESKGKRGDFNRYLYSNIFSSLYISYRIKMGVLKSKLHMWRCPIKQHPKFLCEKIISQPYSFQKHFFLSR